MEETQLQARIVALEVAFKEVKKLKGVPGPRGPAEPIDAAVENANRAVADAEDRLQVRADATYERYHAPAHWKK